MIPVKGIIIKEDQDGQGAAGILVALASEFWGLGCPEIYNEVATRLQKKLFLELQEAFATHGINSLYSLSNVEDFDVGPELSKILCNMAPDAIDKFIEILMAPAVLEDKISGLFEPRDPDFDRFLANNTLSFLGGGNGRVYLITPNAGAPYLLKLTHRLGASRFARLHLDSTAVKSSLAPELAVRYGNLPAQDAEERGFNTHGTLSRMLSIAPFFSEGDLLIQSTFICSPYETRARALWLYSQVLDILITINHANFAFFDMKSDNWAVDAQDKVWIIDDKSITFTNKGVISVDALLNCYGHAVITTPIHMDIPEFHRELFFSADAMHAYLFGKLLYEFLTGNALHPTMYKAASAQDYDFSSNVFKGRCGSAFKNLIERLVIPCPDKRIGLGSVRAIMNNMSQLHEQELLAQSQNSAGFFAKEKDCSTGSEEHRSDMTLK